MSWLSKRRSRRKKKRRKKEHHGSGGSTTDQQSSGHYRIARSSLIASSSNTCSHAIPWTLWNNWSTLASASIVRTIRLSLDQVSHVSVKYETNVTLYI